VVYARGRALADTEPGSPSRNSTISYGRAGGALLSIRALSGLPAALYSRQSQRKGETVGNFYEDTIKKHKDFKSTKVISDLELLEPNTRDAVKQIIDAGKGKFMVYETYRSKERQEELFKKKVTKLQKVGCHHYGIAADIVLVDSKGGPSWKGSKEDWKLLKSLAEDADLISGQDWGNPKEKHSFVDEPHVQRIRLSHQAALFAGKWYPNDDYDPWDEKTWPKK
jgi:hypothetical protein